jgi:hypothetical protein
MKKLKLIFTSTYKEETLWNRNTCNCSFYGAVRRPMLDINFVRCVNVIIKFDFFGPVPDVYLVLDKYNVNKLRYIYKK